MFDLDYEDDVKVQWLAEARAEAKQQNPLIGYCERVYFTRTSCRRRGGPQKGKKRKRTTHEVELLKFLPSGRCVEFRDLHTKGLDSLAEEVLSGRVIPPETTPARLFVEYFREL